MEGLKLILMVVYGLLLTFILIYSFVQLSLVVHYLKKKRNTHKGKLPNDWPLVTVQLPVYNERYVIERLIDAVCKFDYPGDKLEIQVVDDSTDETQSIIAERVQHWRKKGLNIKQVLRDNRKGYKAGALAHATPLATGELVAIFDADFVPRPDFLKNTIPHFRDQSIGVVQTRWEHLNKNYSLLTKLQAFGLDAHFSIEQRGRNIGKHFINFNGTAGVWRKQTIADAGGWESDTLTEDLDLSYRAQLKGWKFLFLEEVGAPAELPANMPALKSQQYRWTKGGAECAVKNLKKVIQDEKLRFGTKLHAAFHLMNSLLFVCILATALLSVPLLVMKHQTTVYNEIIQWGAVFVISLIILSIFYAISFVNGAQSKWRAILVFPLRFFMFLSVSMGMSLHNAIAVVEGLYGKKTPFVRTPKFSLEDNKGGWTGKKYLTKSISGITFLEGLLALYFGFGIFLTFKYQDFGLLPYFGMLFIGFCSVYYYSLKHSLKR